MKKLKTLLIAALLMMAATTIFAAQTEYHYYIVTSCGVNTPVVSRFELSDDVLLFVYDVVELINCGRPEDGSAPEDNYEAEDSEPDDGSTFEADPIPDEGGAPEESDGPME